MTKLNLGKDLYLKGRIGWQGLSKDEYLPTSNFKIINATALMDGYVDWNNCGYISEERYNEASDIQLKEEDILISKDGTLGKIGYVKNLTSPCSVASGIFVLRNTRPDLVDFDYLYHILKSNIFKNFIHRYKALGSTISHLYQRDLNNFEIELPNLDVQKKVAKVLNNLDSKIANNISIISELESLAKTIYDYWFLQFEFPNEDGKPYKSSGGKMIWNEELKREIPEGWTCATVSSISKKVKVGFVGSIEKYYCKNQKDGVIIVRPAEMGITGIDFKRLKHVTFDFHEKNKKSQVHWGDIIIPRCGKDGIPNIYDSKLEGQVLNAVIIEPNFQKASSSFMMECLKSKFSQVQIKNGTSGSVQGVVNTAIIANVKLPYSEQICRNFCRIADNLYKKISDTRKENQELESLRDFLLPLLMNGQVTFKD